MSSQRGNVSRSRPQKHQNTTAFKNDLHDKTSKMKLINSVDIAGVCPRCKDIIEWKRTYRKYKPLKIPKKCTYCDEKSVTNAYHVVCVNCAQKTGVCAKCLQPGKDIIAPQLTHKEEAKEKQQFQQELKLLSERQRRALLRTSVKPSSLPDSPSFDEKEGSITCER